MEGQKHSIKNIIILLFFAFIIVVISSFTTYYYLSSDKTVKWKTSCKINIINPLNKYKECEMTGKYNSSSDKKMCEEINGTYISCASPCRHDPPGTTCIQVCVPLCEFD